MRALRAAMTRPPSALTLLLLAMAASACESKSERSATSAAASVQTRQPSSFGLGHAPTAGQLAAMDIDVNPAGIGLPAGEGTASTGAAIYAQKCALCHGSRGEGQGPYPQLIGRVPAPGFVFAGDAKAPKTIGNYWPYATTVYDYVRRTMPFNAPGSLTPTETYALVAYLLSENGIVPATAVMNAKTLPAVQMPARPHFVPDNRASATSVR